MRFSESDRCYVTRSLGREPVGVVGVAARDARHQPSVIINLPLLQTANGWQPFPTLYWLVDPRLNAQISDIERRGGVKAVETALQNDPAWMQAHLKENRLYAKSRWAVLNEKERQAAEDHGYSQVLRDSGIGGVTNHASIKCLHTQFAFHLARQERGTAVGRILMNRFGLSL